MKNKELYKQLATLIDEYNNVKNEALKKVTDFADEHGLIASIFDKNIECHAYYVPDVDYNDINWEDNDEQHQIQYLKRQYSDHQFHEYITGNWVTSSAFC